ncbi:mechanosensitive ion channel domain-containing protein [Patiriisocius sp. Uisw_017]|jgi:small-conductance mechanosensitive channel|uniref:mechanosensitive ion channel domain-containing protein n=1 Tax=Patiriisocius sp. Uisw_017 TaxID=3230968 RepID=UPI0039E89591
MEYYQYQILKSVIAIAVLVILRTSLLIATKRFAQKIERLEKRTNLIIKHINFGFIFLLFVSLFFIWGVEISDLGLVMSSVFAVVGIGFFAQWSILSNITSGIIMFFIFPYKIGDFIKLYDKENDFEGTIEDIKTFHIIIKGASGDFMTYPNSMMLQKGVSVVKPEALDAYLIREEEIKKEKAQEETVKEDLTN